jgi:hypothetical protein
MMLRRPPQRLSCHLFYWVHGGHLVRSLLVGRCRFDPHKVVQFLFKDIQIMCRLRGLPQSLFAAALLDDLKLRCSHIRSSYGVRCVQSSSPNNLFAL